MKQRICSFTVAACFAASCTFAQTPIVGLGDSLGEGVQSENAFSDSQVRGYLNLIATQSKVALALPLIKSNFLGEVGSATGRSRVSPTTAPADLAVSGATIDNILNTAASSNIQTEADLVLSPYYGLTQIQAAQSLQPGIIYCWAGNDDLINYILDFNHLNNPTGITPLPQFTASYQQLIADLKATGAQVVLGNIADFTNTAYLFDNDDLTKYTGTNFNLPTGSATTLGAVILYKLGKADGSIFSSPAYVLSASQISSIRSQIMQYNQVIQTTAASAGFPVVDTFSVVDYVANNSVKIGGFPITVHYNGGGFSLDGIHPSNTGYALFANAFIKAANQAYGLTIPQISSAQEGAIAQTDPFVDRDGNGVVAGRPNTGLLETLGPILGFSGQKGNTRNIDKTAKMSASDFMRKYFAAVGKDPNTLWGDGDVVNAVGRMLGAPAH